MHCNTSYHLSAHFMSCRTCRSGNVAWLRPDNMKVIIAVRDNQEEELTETEVSYPDLSVIYMDDNVGISLFCFCEFPYRRRHRDIILCSCTVDLIYFVFWCVIYLSYCLREESFWSRIFYLKFHGMPTWSFGSQLEVPLSGCWQLCSCSVILGQQ